MQAYGLASYVNTDFQSPRQNVGGTVGGDLNLFHFGRLQPSLDARASGSFGDATHQYFFGGGPRLAVDLGRFHPYGDFLVGYGALHYVHPGSSTYTGDNSFVTSFGGGVDFSLNRSWAIRADVQRQNWDIGVITPAFHPTSISVGLRYQFHFKSKSGPE